MLNIVRTRRIWCIPILSSYQIKVIAIKSIHRNNFKKCLQPIRVSSGWGFPRSTTCSDKAIQGYWWRIAENININNLSPEQQKELMKLIQEYRIIFNGQLKKAIVGSLILNKKSAVVREKILFITYRKLLKIALLKILPKFETYFDVQ